MAPRGGGGRHSSSASHSQRHQSSTVNVTARQSANHASDIPLAESVDVRKQKGRNGGSSSNYANSAIDYTQTNGHHVDSNAADSDWLDGTTLDGKKVGDRSSVSSSDSLTSQFVQRNSSTINSMTTEKELAMQRVKIKQVMDITGHGEDQVATALHDAAWDQNAAVELLLCISTESEHNLALGSWEESAAVKKKKKKSASDLKTSKTTDTSANGRSCNTSVSSRGHRGRSSGANRNATSNADDESWEPDYVANGHADDSSRFKSQDNRRGNGAGRGSASLSNAGRGGSRSGGRGGSNRSNGMSRGQISNGRGGSHANTNSHGRGSKRSGSTNPAASVRGGHTAGHGRGAASVVTSASSAIVSTSSASHWSSPAEASDCQSQSNIGQIDTSAGNVRWSQSQQQQHVHSQPHREPAWSADAKPASSLFTSPVQVSSASTSNGMPDTRSTQGGHQAPSSASSFSSSVANLSQSAGSSGSNGFGSFVTSQRPSVASDKETIALPSRVEHGVVFHPSQPSTSASDRKDGSVSSLAPNGAPPHQPFEDAAVSDVIQSRHHAHGQATKVNHGADDRPTHSDVSASQSISIAGPVMGNIIPGQALYSQKIDLDSLLQKPAASHQQHHALSPLGSRICVAPDDQARNAPTSAPNSHMDGFFGSSVSHHQQQQQQQQQPLHRPGVEMPVSQKTDANNGVISRAVGSRPSHGRQNTVGMIDSVTSLSHSRISNSLDVQFGALDIQFGSGGLSSSIGPVANNVGGSGASANNFGCMHNVQSAMARPISSVVSRAPDGQQSIVGRTVHADDMKDVQRILPHHSRQRVVNGGPYEGHNNIGSNVSSTSVHHISSSASGFPSSTINHHPGIVGATYSAFSAPKSAANGTELGAGQRNNTAPGQLPYGMQSSGQGGSANFDGSSRSNSGVMSSSHNAHSSDQQCWPKVLPSASQNTSMASVGQLLTDLSSTSKPHTTAIGQHMSMGARESEMAKFVGGPTTSSVVAILSSGAQTSYIGDPILAKSLASMDAVGCVPVSSDYSSHNGPVSSHDQQSAMETSNAAVNSLAPQAPIRVNHQLPHVAHGTASYPPGFNYYYGMNKHTNYHDTSTPPPSMQHQQQQQNHGNNFGHQHYVASGHPASKLAVGYPSAGIGGSLAGGNFGGLHAINHGSALGNLSNSSAIGRTDFGHGGAMSVVGSKPVASQSLNRNNASVYGQHNGGHQFWNNGPVMAGSQQQLW